MGFRDRLFELTAPEEVDEFLKQHPNCALFKAGGCHKTMQGFGYVEQVMGSRELLPVGFIRVIENRPASNHVAELTNIIHESPQYILFKDGKPVYDVDNWNITPEALETALLQHFGPVTQEQMQANLSFVNLDSYAGLLDDYLKDRIDEQHFTEQWLYTFRQDNTLRSTEEFKLLNSLFGDVDMAISSLENGQNVTANSLRMRAESLFQRISSR
jgi:bacillithiol system protein YtxJ